MIKIYKRNDQWIGECTSLAIMVTNGTEKEVIHDLCFTLESFLISSYRKGKLKKILDDQKGVTQWK